VIVHVLRQLDDRVFRMINDLARATPWLHSLVRGYAGYGLVLLVLLLGAGVVAARTAHPRTLAAAGWTGVAAVLALAVNQPLGHLVAERRPYATMSDILVLADRGNDYAFPSDHAVVVGAVTAGLLLVSHRLALTAAVLGALMLFARVYIAAHYPWDVIAGSALGATVTLIGWVVLRSPLTVATVWLRHRPGLRIMFAPAN
jgi:membrane-associated phospholipid phosphatase